MPNPRVAKKVEKMLKKGQLDFFPHPNGNSYLIPVNGGRVAVTIDLVDWAGPEATVLHLQSEVLERIEAEPAKVTEAVNRLNNGLPFVKFCFDGEDAQIIAVYDLVGDYLEHWEELKALIVGLGDYVDEHSVKLREEFGGVLGVDALREAFGMETSAPL